MKVSHCYSVPSMWFYISSKVQKNDGTEEINQDSKFGLWFSVPKIIHDSTSVNN